MPELHRGFSNSFPLASTAKSRFEKFEMRVNYKNAFTLVELLVAIAIIGVLAGLILPAIQQAREASRRMHCSSNLRQLGLATLLFHDTYGVFPPGRIAPKPGDEEDVSCGGEEPTWPVHVLPFIEQFSLRSEWEPFEPWYHQSTKARVTPIPLFTCPSRRSPSQTLGKRQISTESSSGGRLPCGCPFPGGTRTNGSADTDGTVSDYAGSHGDLSPGANGLETDFYFGGNGTGVLITSRAVCRDGKPFDWADKLRLINAVDGTSNTILIGEKHVPAAQLLKFPEDSPMYDGDHLPASMRLAGPGLPIAQGPFDNTSSFFSFGSWHVGSSQFVLLDGSVKSFSTSMDTVSLGQLTNRSNSQVEEVFLND
jgi:prepilin-type N-terminal cleavage/methylation domain-containing protein